MLIDIVNNPCTIWITGEISKMDNAERDAVSLIDKMRIQNFAVPINPLKLRFLTNHLWSSITEKIISCEAEGVGVEDISSGYLKITGTEEGKKEMIIFIRKLIRNVKSKVRTLFHEVQT